MLSIPDSLIRNSFVQDGDLDVAKYGRYAVLIYDQRDDENSSSLHEFQSEVEDKMYLEQSYIALSEQPYLRTAQGRDDDGEQSCSQRSETVVDHQTIIVMAKFIEHTDAERRRKPYERKPAYVITRDLNFSVMVWVTAWQRWMKANSSLSVGNFVTVGTKPIPRSVPSTARRSRYFAPSSTKINKRSEIDDDVYTSAKTQAKFRLLESRIKALEELVMSSNDII